MSMQPGWIVIEKAQRDMFGFLNVEQLAAIAADDTTRLVKVLARFHQGRFEAPAQDAVDIIATLRAAGWTIRDVSIVGSPVRPASAPRTYAFATPHNKD